MTIKEFEQLQSDNPAFMLYFHNDTCGVCKFLYPKVESLMNDKFPNIKLLRVAAGESRELAGQLRMLSVPGILLFLEGKEYLRSNGMVSMEQMESQIQRPYTLMFD